MSRVLFEGCLHLGHENMAKRRGFKDAYEHDEHLIENWNKVVHKRDKVFILGDITMETPEHYHKLDRLKGQKVVILGNHDRPHDVPELLKYVNQVAGMIRYKGAFLTHCPVHPHELQYRGVNINIHAHVHENDKFWNPNQYYNVDAHKIGYKPKTLEELKKEHNKVVVDLIWMRFDDVRDFRGSKIDVHSVGIFKEEVSVYDNNNYIKLVLIESNSGENMVNCHYLPGTLKDYEKYIIK